MKNRLIIIEKIVAYIKNDYLYTGALLAFIVIATIISSNFSRDSIAYNNMFSTYGISGWGAFSTEIFKREIFILFISKAFYQLGLSAVFLFLIHAVISLFVKFYLIYKCSKDKWLSLVLFGSYFFILHDATQIRFSMATAFTYLGLLFLARGKKYLFTAIVVLSAIMFHLASLVFIVMLFFTTRRSALWLFGMVVLALLLHPVNLHTLLLSIMENASGYLGSEETFISKLHMYLLKPSQDEYLGLLKPTIIAVYVAVIILFQYRSKFTAYEVLCYNALILSVFFYILFKDIVDLQIRSRDIFLFSLVFLVPYIHEWLSMYVSKKNAYMMLLFSFLAYLVKFLFYDKMLVL